jgi:hypothetical protein
VGGVAPGDLHGARHPRQPVLRHHLVLK